MKIISVDNERMSVEYMGILLHKVEPEANFKGFTNVEDACEYISTNEVDVAFLDIQMEPYSGIELAKQYKDLRPKMNIIFVTGYPQYTMDALHLHASGYLMKPVRADDLRKELDNLRHPICNSLDKKVKIQTFGNFEVYVDGKPLNIPIGKCRECLAYLVDRKGARITVAELAAVLWEDRPYDKRVQNNAHRIMSDTMRYLRKAGIADIVIKLRGEMAIDIEKVECDYFRFLKGDMSQINAFQGEYMTNYGWAEFTLGILLRKINTG